MTEHFGYPRQSGRAGARDRILVLPSVVCAGLVAERLENGDAVALTHQHGCLQVGDDLAHSAAVLAGLGTNPNVAATVIVSLGCETLQGRALAEEISARGRRAELVGIQAAGGTAEATSAGRALVKELYAQHGGQPREPVPTSDLLFGIDATDGELAEALEHEAAARGIAVIRPEAPGPVVHPELAAAGAQVIVSVLAADQAPTGFALCPVIAVGIGGDLHEALATDFDSIAGNREAGEVAREALDQAEACFNGELCQAELRGSREFVLRRLSVTM